MIKNIAIIGGNIFDSLSFHIHYTLKKMGYNPEFFDLGTPLERNITKDAFFYLVRFSQAYEKNVFNRLADRIISFNPDLIFVIYRTVPPYVIKRLKNELKSKIIFFTSDAFVNIERGYSLISDYDLYIVKDKIMENTLRDKLGLNVETLPECMNPDFHKPPEQSEFGSLYQLSIVGSLYPYRAKVLASLINEFNLKIFGNIPRWMESEWGKYHTHRYVTGKEKSRVFYGSKINLNIMHFAEFNSGNCRLFEIAGAGGFQICDEKPAIKELFTENKEMIFYNNLGDLKDKIRYYLNHQDEAIQIASEARERALKEHTYDLRLKTIFTLLDGI